MAESKSKYSLGEAAAVLGISALAIPLFVVAIGVPLALMGAWMESVAWNWFMPKYLGLPHLGVWIMFAIGLVLSLFRDPSPMLKKEFYYQGVAARMLSPVIGRAGVFFIAWLTHMWVLP